MPGTVLLILHTRSADPSVIEAALARHGFASMRICPKYGGLLPERHDGYAASIIFGGTQSMTHAELRPYLVAEMAWLEKSLGAGKPFFGICLGAQMLARIYGGRVTRHPELKKQIGYYPVHPTAAGRGLFDEGLHVYHWHGDGFEMPAGGKLLATGSTFPNEAFSMDENAYGVQFHPEIDGAIMRRWIKAGIEDGDMKHNGVQSGEQQEALRRIHEPGMQAWLDRFLAHWLGAPDATQREAVE